MRTDHMMDEELKRKQRAQRVDWPKTTPSFLDVLFAGKKADWSKCWDRYHLPIQNYIKNCLALKGKAQSESNINACLSDAYSRLQTYVSENYKPEKGAFRPYLRTVIYNVIQEKICELASASPVKKSCDDPVGGEDANERRLEEIPQPAKPSQEEELEDDLWVLAVTSAVLSYVKARFAWSDTDLKVIELLISKVADAKTTTDAAEALERGLVKQTAVELGLCESQVSKTKTNYFGKCATIYDRYKKENLMLQSQSVIDKPLFEMIRSDYFKRLELCR